MRQVLSVSAMTVSGLYVTESRASNEGGSGLLSRLFTSDACDWRTFFRGLDAIYWPMPNAIDQK